MKIINTIITAVAILFIASCARTSFHVQERNDSATATIDTAQHYFISGLGQRKDIDASEICGGPEKIVKVETQMTFLNGLLGFITFGIYTPQQTRVYCSK